MLAKWFLHASIILDAPPIDGHYYCEAAWLSG